MRKIERDSAPYIADRYLRMAGMQWHTFWAQWSARWWGVDLGRDCAFFGRPRFHRHPKSRITIGERCRFRSSPASNLIGVNRPCIIATLAPGAEIEVGSGSGFSGTVISAAQRITLGEDVRCGANTLITDTDWHTDDPRSGGVAPVTIGKNVWLGMNVSVLKGVTIGENVLVAAGSVVVDSLPDGVIAGGVPARILRKYTG
jgi:acetyltransferase-like isoleucine patch superfamily enzyme